MRTRVQNFENLLSPMGFEVGIGYSFLHKVCIWSTNVQQKKHAQVQFLHAQVNDYNFELWCASVHRDKKVCVPYSADTLLIQI